MELQGIQEGLALTKIMGITDIFVKSDAKEVVGILVEELNINRSLIFSFIIAERCWSLKYLNSDTYIRKLMA